MSDPPILARSDGNDPADELGSLARELARGYAELVESHRRAWGIAPAEAEAKARENGEWAVAAARTDPPDQVNWWTLSTAMERDPEAARMAWERVKAEAKKELHTGHRSAAALEWGGKPWDRARYLALREAFAEDWQPRGAVESALLDVLAQSFSAYLKWTERATTQAEAEAQTEDAKLKQDGYWQPPRVMTGEYMAWCADQAEAAHKRFLATLKTLHDLRRLPAVFVAGAGQVNVASQQVNVSGSGTKERRRAGREDSSKSSGKRRDAPSSRAGTRAAHERWAGAADATKIGSCAGKEATPREETEAVAAHDPDVADAE